MPLTLPHAFRRLTTSQFLPKRIATAAYSSTTAGPPPWQSRTLKLAAGTLTLAALGLGTYTYTSTTSTPPTLNPTTFTPYTLHTTPLTDGPTPTRLFTLTPAAAPPAPTPHLLTTSIHSLQIKQPQLQIARSYTPLPPTPLDPPGAIRLLVKKEPGGEMSRYLFSLRDGATVELRGPHTEYEYAPSDHTGERKVVFFAGGTGIAPALQVAAGLLGGGKGVGEVLWAVRRREETEGVMGEVVGEVLRSVGKDRLVVRVFVDGEGGIRREDVEAAVGGGRTKVFVSGPEGFIGWIAGPKELRDGREEQGALGGMVGAALRRKGGDVEVFKL